MSIRIEGAEAAFDICWDKDGIAHIFAGSIADAYRGMGYAVGSERLWQIHLSNLYATGMAASVMGKRFVGQDLLHQAFRVPAWDMPESPGDWIVDAYLEGLNAYVRGLDEVPAEFLKAGTEPRLYTRHDVASRYRFTGWFQHKTWVEKIYIGKLMARHGSEWFSGHVRRFSAEDASLIEELREPLNALDPRVAHLLFPLESIKDGRPDRGPANSGSNNWAIRSELSASGSPMLATDPHQPHSIPNTFFYSHLNAPGWDAFGASFPGMPYFMMGFNRQLAWGLTTGFIDSYDVYVERETSVTSDTYDIAVAGEAERTFTVDRSRHGPILESLTDALGITPAVKRRYRTSLHWVMRDLPTSAGALALLPMAKSAEEFGHHLFENDICPLVNNIICVDQDNDLRRFIAATLPRRKGVTGTVPLPGWREECNFPISRASELLVEHNPECGYALTANNDTMGEEGDYPIHNFPTFSARADRIRQLLDEHQGLFTSADFERMQLDLKDLKALEWIPGILSCMTEPTESVQSARTLLETWDGFATLESAAACIYYPLLDKRWYVQFMHKVLKDDLLLSLPTVAMGLNRFSIEEFMAEGSPWRDHRSVLETIINTQISSIKSNLDREFGATWNWGKIHQIRVGHSLAKHPAWQHLKLGPNPIGGSGTTLRMAMHLPVKEGSEAVEVYHGPAFRWIVDLADPLHFRFVIAGGNGGRTDSRFTLNQYDDWLAGRYRDVSLVRDELELVVTLRVEA